MKNSLILLCVLLFSIPMAAKEENPPKKNPFFTDFMQTSRRNSNLFSLGIKTGVPNLLSLNGEFNIPVSKINLSPFIEYGGFDITLDNESRDHRYLEYGLNIYFNQSGKGLYGSVSKRNFNSKVNFYEIDLENDLIGQGGTSLKFDTYNFKIGYKTSKRLFFRFEIGYGVGKIPETLTYTASASNGFEIEQTVPIPKIPGIGSNGLLIGNVGVGFAF